MGSRRIAALVMVAFVLPGCSVLSRPRIEQPAVRHEWATTVALHGKPLELHLAMPQLAAPPVLVLYASGDGGWFGAAVEMFHRIAGAGYNAVGFSSRAFLKIQRPGGKLTTAAQVAAEYEQILMQARAALGLDAATPAILTGWSRGAAFAVLVGSEPEAQHDLLGVVAIGLSEGEDLGVGGPEYETDEGRPSPERRQWPFDTYARIAAVHPLPCAVIQSDHDDYLPSPRARQLFGADTPLRRFYSVAARNHRFSGGTVALDAALLDALRWIAPLDGGQ